MKAHNLRRVLLLPLILYAARCYGEEPAQTVAPPPQEEWEKAIDLYQRGEFREARPLLEREASRLLSIGKSKTAATVLNYSGLAKTFLGDYEAARSDIQQSQDIFRKSEEPAGVTLTLISFGFFYREQGLGREAFDSYEEARAVLSDDKDKIGSQKFAQLLVAVENGLGAVYLEQGSYTQSLGVLEKIQPFLKGDFPNEEAEIRKNLAILYSMFQKNEQAAAELLRANGNYLEVGNSYGKGEINLVEASLLARQGSYGEALTDTEIARKQFLELGLEVFQGKVALERGRLMLELGVYNEAEKEAKTAERLFEGKKNPVGSARALLLLGQIYYARSGGASTKEIRERNLKQAELTLNDVLRRFIVLNLIGDLTETRNTLGGIHFDLGSTELLAGAKEDFNSGLALTQITGDSRRAAESMWGLAVLAVHRGNEDEAVQYLEDGRKRAVESTSPVLLTRIEMDLIAIYLKEGNNKKVLALLRQVIIRLQALAQTGKLSTITIVFMEKQSDVLENVILVLAHLQKQAADMGEQNSLPPELSDLALGRSYAEMSFNIAEMARGKTSPEVYGNSQLDLRTWSLPERIRSLEEAYLKRLKALTEALADKSMDSQSGQILEALKGLQQEQDEFQAFKDSLRSDPEQRVRAYAAIKYPKAVLMRDIRLNKNEILLAFKVLDTHTLIWVVKPGNILVAGMTRRIGRDDHSAFSNLMQEIRNPKEGSDRYKEFAQAVCEQLRLSDLLKDVPARTLVHVVPDYFLYALPLETLVCRNGNQSEFLGERYEFIYHPSATVFEMNRIAASSLKKWQKPLLAFAKPHNTQYLRLGDEAPQMESTASNVAAELGVSNHDSAFFRVGSDASESFLKQLDETGELTKFRYVLFATHGYDSLPEVRGESALLLSNGNGEDGLLDFDEAINLSLDADLVFVSTCESGISEALLKTEGVLSLAKAFELAGARSVVASLWEVDPSATEYLVTRFFHHLVRENHPKHEALSLARKDVAEHEHYGHPYYWASFVLVGEP